MAADNAKNEQPAGGSMMGQIQIAAVVAIIVAIECAIAYFLFPTADDIAAQAAAQVEQKQADATDFEDPLTTDEPTRPIAEVELGNYSVTVPQQTANSALRVDFTLWGTVLLDDQSDFDARYAEHINRLREAVIVTVRQTDIEGLSDPSLGLLKRKIQDKVNRRLGKPLLQSVLFSDFSFIEQ